VETTERQARLSTHQLRVLLNDFVLRSATRIEADADHILAQSDDPAIRRNALRWKINAIAAGYRAGFHKHPLASYVDLSILNKQMSQLFTSPAGHSLFGPWQPVAVSACEDLERQLGTIQEAIGADLPLNEQFARNFAAEHPVADLYFDRESLAARYIDEVREPGGELIEAVSHLQQDLNDFKRLARTYAEHLPKQARWEAELMLMDAAQTTVVRQPLQDLSRTSEAISRIAGVSEQLPELVERERDILRDVARSERQAVMEELDTMRRTSFEKLELEREILLDAARAERQAVSSQLERHVAEAIAATEQISERRVREAAGHGMQLVDHVFLRTTQVLASLSVLAVVVLLGAACAWKLWRRPASGSPAALPPPGLASSAPGDSHPLASESTRRAA
jgi:hypothetical protein